MKTFFRPASLFVIAAAIGLAACSSKPTAPPPALNEGAAAAAAANETDNQSAEAAPAANIATPQVSEAQSKSEPVGDPNALPPSDGGPPPQVRDDADASGMTARLPEADDVQPAEK